MNREKKTPLILFEILLTLVLISATCVFRYEYLRWEKLPLIIILTVLSGLTFGVAALLLLKTIKNTASVKPSVLAFVGGFFGFSVVQWATLLLVNMNGLQNLKAVKAACAVIFCLLAAMLIVTGVFSAVRQKRYITTIAVVALSALPLLYAIIPAASADTYSFFVTAAAQSTSAETRSRTNPMNYVDYNYNLTYEWTYPIYRVFRDIGGTATENKSITYDLAYSTEKTLQTDNMGSDTSLDLSLAKNEIEGLQILFAAERKGQSVSVDVTDFKNKAGETLPVNVYKEMYTAVPDYGDLFSDKYADALVPVAGDDLVSLEKNKSQAFYIETRTGSDSAAGKYTATFTAKDGSGNVILTTELTANVWNFTLPEKTSSDTAMGIFASSFNELNGIDDNGYGAMYKKYYDYLLDRKISAYTLPYDILDERADAYMSDERVTSFIIPYSEDDATLVKYYTKVSENPLWAAKGCFYPIDEPNDAEAYARYTEITERLNRLCPGYNMVTPFCTQKVTIAGTESSAVQLQLGKSSVLCAISDMFDKDGFYDEMNTAVSEGSRMWWYVCNAPRDAYNNVLIKNDAIQSRVLFWQQKKLNITGFLYWDSVYWDLSNPWESSRTFDCESDFITKEAAGDGCLLYPGANVGIDGAVGTLRLINITDGLEDYDYLALAQNKLGSEWVNEKINEITTSLTESTSDDALLLRVRAVIGDALSE